MMWPNLCPWGTFSLVIDILFLIVGIVLVVRTTKWALRKGWVGEKYCIALLAAIVIMTYICLHYDVKKLKCTCPAPITKVAILRK